MKKKNNNKGCLIALGIIVLIFVIGSIEGGLDDTDAVPKTVYGKKEAKINKWNNGSGDAQANLMSEIDAAIKSQFAFPQSVEYQTMDGFINHAMVTDADTGLCVTRGIVNAKNGYGVPVQYHYLVNYIITDSSYSLTRVLVEK